MEDSEKIFDKDLKLKKALNNDVEDLYVTSRFPPLVDVSGIVFSKRIIKANKKVDVVFSNFNDEKDFEFEKVINNFIDKKYIIDGNYMHSTSDGINFFRKEALKKVNESNKKYKNIVSRSWTLESHFFALDYKLQHPDVVWTAEYSDPLRFDITNNLRMATFNSDEEYFDNINAKIQEINKQVFGDETEKYWPEIKSGDKLYCLAEYLPFLFADVVRFTNPNQREIMLDEFPFDIKDFVMAKSEVSRHPTLDEEYYYLKESSYEVDDDYLNFAYFGTYLGKRHLEFLFKCLEDLNDDLSDRIRLHLFVPNPEVFKLSLRDPKNIVTGEKAPFLEFLNLTTKMDVLIVNDLLTEDVFDVNPFLPSKLADYMGSNNDIWVVCEKDSSMDKLPFKYKSYVNDFDSSRRVFENILTDKIENCGNIFKEDIDSEEYYQNRLTNLNNALDELYKQRLYWVKRTRLADRNVNLLKKDVAKKDSSISSLTSERDSLTKDVSSLTSERDSLAKDVSSLTSERDSLSEDVSSLTSERDSLSEDVSSLTSERDSLIADVRSRDSSISSLTSERDSLTKDVSSLTSERDSLAKDISSLTNERDSLSEDVSSLTSERDSLIADVRSRDSSISSLTSERDSLTKDISSLTAERNSLIEDINNKKSELNSLREDFVELHDVAKLSFDQLAVKDDIISDKDNELDYYKNHGFSIKDKILTPVEYSYLILKSQNKELKLNYDLFKLIKNCNWFNRGYYLNNNKDLSRLWINILSPELHYVCHGIDEERLPNRETIYNPNKKELLRKLKYIKNMK